DVANQSPREKSDPLSVQALTIHKREDKAKKENAADYTLTWQGEDWQLSYPVAERPTPVQDLPDPDKLKTILTAVPDIWADLFVGADTLRDARLARFRSEDARRVELTLPEGTIILAKDKERWRLEQPIKADAETAKVNELLDKLSGLQAQGNDGLDKPTEATT